MNRQEIVAIRQRLIERSLQPIAVYNWDFPGIPLKHRGKRPIESNWQNTIGMPAYYDTAQNTGVLTGSLYPLDIDVDDPAIVDEIVTMAEKLFGGTIVRCRRNSPRRLLPYRIDNSDARKIIVQLACGKLEFLGHGQQFVGFGKHTSGVHYEWQGKALDAIEIAELPIIDDAKISALRAWAESRWPVPETAKPNGTGRTNGANGAKADFRNTTIREDVEAALRALPCDYDREAWVRLSKAYSVGGGSYEVFLEWSRQHPDYRAESWVRGQWNSFKHEPPKNKRPITVATLFAEVFERFPGWKKPSERGTDYTGPAGDDEDWDSEPDGEGNSAFEDEALPLSAELREGEPYPLEALGSLQGAIEGIAKAGRMRSGFSRAKRPDDRCTRYGGDRKRHAAEDRRGWTAVVPRDDSPLKRTKIIGR
jgi:hypothetical protein